MLNNVGLIDRIVRFVIAAALFVVGFLNIESGYWWIGLIGLVPLITGAVGYCPLFHLTKISTVKKFTFGKV